ncbi:MAG: tol-pal system-associated acyl-CoA thioesterase [Betaproteobacteria bacterium]|nr:tol-pal system-associated acyl-CoA thioesterase [Betaproteobacteria bacterium]
MAKLTLKNAQQTELFTFAYPMRVYFEDTDASGVVYHARYIHFLERARTEWLRTLGFNNGELNQKHSMFWVVSEVTVNYLRPARLDDALQVSVAIESMGRVRCTFHQEIRRGEETLIKARITVACVGAANFKPIEIPAEVRKKMEATC